MVDRHQLIAEAEEASRLLNGPVFRDAFANAEARFIAAWRTCLEPEEREMYWAKVVGLDEVRRQLRRIVSQGEHASLSPDRDEE